MESVENQDGRTSWRQRHEVLIHVVGAVFLLYVFLLSISMMGAAFKLFGTVFAEKLIVGCSNPTVGLFIGVLATGLLQSSSTTTSLTVGFVGGGVLPIEFAIPIIMGANIGTTITNILVSFGFVTRKEDFRRAFAGATVHDFFNIFSVAVLFPLETHFHFIQALAETLTRAFGSAGGVAFASPLKAAIKPVCSFIKHFLVHTVDLPQPAAGGIMLGAAIVALITSLVFLVKTLRTIIVNKAERFVNRFLFRNDFTALVLGLCLTVFVQSSSVTTSLVVPLVGAGVVTLHRCYPFTLGANIGTTCTALLAAMATVTVGEGGTLGVTAAFAHLVFNIIGIAIFYPLRALPIWAARKLADLAADSKRWAILFVFIIFFGLPMLIIFLSRPTTVEKAEFRHVVAPEQSYETQ
ncbi:Na/Pi symporter [Verrucomicrobiota bacterium]